MKVPIEETTLTPQAGPAPQEARAPQPIEGAYGANVHEAAAGMGQAVQGVGDVLGQHVAKMAEYQSQESAYNASEQYRKATTNLQYGDGSGTDTVKRTLADGTAQQVPAGLLNRHLDQAHDVTAEYLANSAKIKDQILSNLNPYAQKIALRHIDALDAINYENVVKHQQKQGNAAYENSLTSQMAGMANGQALAAQTPDQLNKVLSSIEDTNTLLHNRRGYYNPDGIGGVSNADSAMKTRENFVSQAVSNSVTNALRTTGDLDQANKLLDGVKDKLSPQSYENISKSLDTQFNHMTALKEKQAKLDLEKNDTSMANQYFDAINNAKPFDLQQLENARIRGAAKLPGGISEGVYSAIKASALDPAKKEQVLADLADTKALMVSKDGKTIDSDAKFENAADYKAQIIKAYKSGFIDKTFYEKGIGVISKVYDKGLDQEINKSYGNYGDVWNYLKNSALSMIGHGPEKSQDFTAAKAYLGKALMDKMASGGVPDDKVREVAQGIMKQYIQSRHPATLGATDTPHSVMSQTTGIQPVFNGQTNIKPDVTVKSPSQNKTPQYTDDDLAFTAQKHGMTVDEVKKKLGIGK